MYRDAELPPERPDSPEAHVHESGGTRKFPPVPLAVVGAFLALFAEFFGLFLLAWGMAPTSIGCGAPRAISMSLAQIPIFLVIGVAFSWAGAGIMRDARESQLRRRSFLVTFGVIYLLGSIPLFALAALFGSCFDF